MGTRELLREGEVLGATGGTGKVAEAGECGRELRFIEHETCIQSSAQEPEGRLRLPSGRTALQAAPWGKPAHRVGAGP